MLGRSEVIHAKTLAKAVAKAEHIKETDHLLGINSLWQWYCALLMDEQAKIGNFEGKYAKMRLWTSARLLCRPRKCADDTISETSRLRACGSRRLSHNETEESHGS